MKEEFFMVSKSMLPDYFEKVVHARELLKTGEVKEVSEAVKRCGISRSTYYKYKDHIFIPRSDEDHRRIILTMLLNHEPGTLGRVLSAMGKAGANVVTINQNPPIAERVAVTVQLDISSLIGDLKTMLEDLKKVPGVENPTIVDME